MHRNFRIGTLGARERDGIEFRSGQDHGFFPTAGDVIDFVPLLAPDPGKVLAVTMEYGTMGTGTLPQLRSAMRIILENQAHIHGCSEPPVSVDVERNFRELFNPSDTSWAPGYAGSGAGVRRAAGEVLGYALIRCAAKAAYEGTQSALQIIHHT